MKPNKNSFAFFFEQPYNISIVILVVLGVLVIIVPIVLVWVVVHLVFAKRNERLIMLEKVLVEGLCFSRLYGLLQSKGFFLALPVALHRATHRFHLIKCQTIVHQCHEIIASNLFAYEHANVQSWVSQVLSFPNY